MHSLVAPSYLNILLFQNTTEPTTGTSPTRLAIYVAIASFIVALLNLFKTHIWPWARAQYDKRSIKKQMGTSLYTDEEIERSLEYYIEPYVQSVDPSGGEEPRALIGVKTGLFTVLDEILGQLSEHRYVILLADSGMGKTSALMNYNARHARRWRKKYEIRQVPLSNMGAIDHIRKIKNKRGTVLLLDAFDEDTWAVLDHVERLRKIVSASTGFRRVLISCRTQFFSKDEEIPREVAILKVAARAAGEPAEYVFHKLYLSPFTKEQAIHYLRRRYPIIKITLTKKPFRFTRTRLPVIKLTWLDRYRALKMADKIPHLAARPMLLAHINVLVEARRYVNYAYELYEEMVEGWIKREKGFIKEPSDLRRFCELLAVELYLNRTKRKAEHIPRRQLATLAKKWKITFDDPNITDWRLSTRSLLNRDAIGNYKFAHRSILEYLYVKRFTLGDSRCLEVEWTDQMLTFLWEVLEKHVITRNKLPFYDATLPINLRINEATICFLNKLTIHGLSLLRSPLIASQRFNAILQTTTALCSVILDPHGEDDPFVSLVLTRGSLRDGLTLTPVAIHYGGKLLNVREAEGLNRYSPANDPGIYDMNIPDVNDKAYPEILRRLKRINSKDKLHSVTMPIKFRGENVALLVGETSRDYAFREDRHLMLVDILKLIGKYAWGYR